MICVGLRGLIRTLESIIQITTGYENLMSLMLGIFVRIIGEKSSFNKISDSGFSQKFFNSRTRLRKSRWCSSLTFWSLKTGPCDHSSYSCAPSWLISMWARLIAGFSKLIVNIMIMYLRVSDPIEELFQVGRVLIHMFLLGCPYFRRFVG